MRARFFSWLLAYANANPPVTRRREFYAVKDGLLQRYGKRVGDDYQRIEDECWGYWDQGCEGKECDKCGGSGVFGVRWVKLERWDFAGRIFHSNPQRIWIGTVPPDLERPVIRGLVRHEGRSYRATSEAVLWLAFLCAPRLWVALLKGSRHCGWQWTPMLALQSAVFTVWHNAARFRPRRCHCGRFYMPAFEPGYVVCRWCSPVRHRWMPPFLARPTFGRGPGRPDFQPIFAAAVENDDDDDDLPF